MRINSIIANQGIGFGARILNEQNEDSVRQLRAKFDNLKQNGIPVGDCFYSIPTDRNVNLTTNYILNLAANFLTITTLREFSRALTQTLKHDSQCRYLFHLTY